jgi:small subunit ribosomal protein S8
MNITDPIADMLTRIRNANLIKSPFTQIPHSKLKEEVARVLYQTGFISEFKSQDVEGHKYIRVYLKYTGKKDRVITGLLRVSKPGRRVYVQKDKIPRILRGMGIVIMSTPKGIVTGQEAAKLNQGGEVLAAVW